MESQQQSSNNENKFVAQDEGEGQPSLLTLQPSTLSLSQMLTAKCTFQSQHFEAVMLNMIRNPNVTSSYVFRADIFYDSEKDLKYVPDSVEVTGFAKHMKGEYRPKHVRIAGYTIQRTFVRQLVPRNPQLDKPLVQTCHILSLDVAHLHTSEMLVVYIPHVDSIADMPWYHPAVQAVVLRHTWCESSTDDGTSIDANECQGEIAVEFALFPDSSINSRLQRTALNLLRTIHKHGQGSKAGYVKRVHHDLVIPQATFQNTYTRLKAQYAKSLVQDWQETTDPTKHVFEDLGIAAFLIELWSQMYSTKDSPKNQDKQPFPGFVDFACGNGVLVYILRQEGFKGWGFDLRARKSWNSFPDDIRADLNELVLIPSPLAATVEDASLTLDSQARLPNAFDGIVPKGTFIVSNHADELTAWAPLLAYLSDSPFIAIPCCSHNLAGARFRAPNPRKSEASREQAAKKASMTKSRQPSIYAALCAYVGSLAEELRYDVEMEMLRIPSTRNAALIGRATGCTAAQDERMQTVQELVRRELSEDLEGVARLWTARALNIASSKGTCH